jgi:hypothetical protein
MEVFRVDIVSLNALIRGLLKNTITCYDLCDGELVRHQPLIENIAQF